MTVWEENYWQDTMYCVYEWCFFGKFSLNCSCSSSTIHPLYENLHSYKCRILMKYILWNEACSNERVYVTDDMMMIQKWQKQWQTSKPTRDRGYMTWESWRTIVERHVCNQRETKWWCWSRATESSLFSQFTWTWFSCVSDTGRMSVMCYYPYIQIEPLIPSLTKWPHWSRSDRRCSKKNNLDERATELNDESRKRLPSQQTIPKN